MKGDLSMYIFLSHSSQNADVALSICKTLESNDYKCFLAPRDIRSGYEYAAEIIEGIDRSDVLLLILSKASNNSPHVLREIERAVSKSIPIIVYKLESVELTSSMEYFLMTHQWLNASKTNHEDLLVCMNNFKNNTHEKLENSKDDAVSPTKNKRRKSTLPLVIVISALVISGAILVGTLILKYGKDKPTSDSTPNENIAISDEDTSNESTSHSEENTSQRPSDETTSSTEDDTTSFEETTTDSEEVTTSPSTEIADVEIGDKIILGKYNDSDITWQVLKIADDGRTAVLISKDVLTMKGFDGADGGCAGYYEGKSQIWQDSPARTDMEIRAVTYGNSSWELSTIRTWLNSEKEYVEYEGARPTDKSFSAYKNGYSEEAGFLYNFTKEERSAIVETTITTKGSLLSGKDSVVTKDRVFLLSTEELDWFEGSGIPFYAIPTPQAIEQNKDYSYRDILVDGYKTNTIFWWLRDPVDDDSAKCHLVSVDVTGKRTDTNLVCVEGWGIRPAITIDLTSEIIKTVE